MILRHAPETIGIQLDNNGWANIAELIERANCGTQTISVDDIYEIVETNEKKRFEISVMMK